MQAANGQYRVTLEDGDDAHIFTDNGKLAVDVAVAMTEVSQSASVWEKNRSGWQKIYPGAVST